MLTTQKSRRLPGIILVVLAALALVGVLIWRLLLAGSPSGVNAVSATFHPTPEGAPVEVGAPLGIDVNLDLSAPAGSGPRISPSVDLQLRDDAGKPAVFGDGPTAPVVMHVGGTLTSWTSDISAPTQPGHYHVHLFVENGPQGNTEIDLAQPVLSVVPAVSYTGGLVYSRNGNLWRTDENGEHTHRLTFYSGDGRAQDPTWTPDGTGIAFARTLPAAANEIPNLEIWGMNPDGSGIHALAQRRPDEDLVMPAFAPDGTLYFTSDRTIDPSTGGTPTIERLQDSLESWSIEMLSPAAPSGTRRTVLPTARMANLSPDGRQMVYLGAPDVGSETEQVPTRTVTLMLASNTGQAPRVLVPDGVFQDMLAPRFSPDGTRIVFSMMLGPNCDIYVASADGGAPQRLTTAPGIDTDPSFSPDGGSIVFESDRSGSQQLYVMSADGSNERRVTFGGGAYAAPAWSPDGEWIAFTRRGADGRRIGIIKPDGSGERLLTTGPGDEAPSWAASSRELIFQRAEGAGNSGLYRISLDGSEARNVVLPQGGSDPDWSGVMD